MSEPELSVVVPFLDEEAVLPLLRSRWERLKDLPEGWELVLVSDGSTDSTDAIVKEMKRFGVADQTLGVDFVELLGLVGRQLDATLGHDAQAGAFDHGVDRAGQIAAGRVGLDYREGAFGHGN